LIAKNLIAYTDEGNKNQNHAAKYQPFANWLHNAVDQRKAPSPEHTGLSEHARHRPPFPEDKDYSGAQWKSARNYERNCERLPAKRRTGPTAPTSSQVDHNRDSERKEQKRFGGTRHDRLSPIQDHFVQSQDLIDASRDCASA